MTCEDTTWLVSDARDRELTAIELADLSHHLASCERCRGASQQFSVLFRQLDAYLAKTDDGG